MKKLAVIFVCATSLLLPAGLYAQASVIKEVETHNIFEGMFLSIWSKLKSFNPTLKQSARSSMVYTAGIRGAESTDTLLKPYWKGDLTRDVQFQSELEQFDRAQQKLDSGELEIAATEFDQFLKQYTDSALRPNALFALGISLAGTGQLGASIDSMKQFIDENPGHPLVGDAEMVIDELSG